MITNKARADDYIDRPKLSEPKKAREHIVSPPLSWIQNKNSFAVLCKQFMTNVNVFRKLLSIRTTLYLCSNVIRVRPPLSK